MKLTRDEMVRMFEEREQTVRGLYERAAAFTAATPHLTRASDIRRARDERKGAMQ